MDLKQHFREGKHTVSTIRVSLKSGLLIKNEKFIAHASEFRLFCTNMSFFFLFPVAVSSIFTLLFQNYPITQKFRRAEKLGTLFENF